jgi:putative ATP-dependent endonuclease of the OLD family
MIVKRLLLKNYRCFGSIPAVINFSQSGLTALIGANNVGKSTALKALEIVLGDKWPSGQFNEDDFHNNQLDETITIACEFSHSISMNIYGIDYDVRGVVLNAKHIQTGYGESSVEVEYFLLNRITNFETENWEIITYGRADRPVRISQGIKNSLPIVITIPLIKLNYEQPTNKWGVLGRMLQKVERKFLTSTQKEGEFKTKMQEAVGILREPQEFKDIEKDIREFWEKTKPHNLSGTNLEFLDFEPWRYYRQFKLAIKRNGKEVPIETLGEGVQRLAIIALYRAYLRRHGRNERAVLLIEEPESYLHPQARRTLFDVLREAVKAESEIEGQIIYTTHSEDFINSGCFDDIVIFSAKSDGVETRHISEDILKKHTLALGYGGSVISDQHIYYRLLETTTNGLKEALFAHKAIIVEGPSEIELFRFHANVDKEQIAIVSADGKSTIPAVYAFLTAFGIPCLVVIDRDSDHTEDNKKIVDILTQANAKLADSTRMIIKEDDINGVADGAIYVNSRLLVFGKKLETALNVVFNGSYSEIVSALRVAFNLVGDSKPREIQALGFAYNGNLNGSKLLEGLMNKHMEKLRAFSKILADFSKQASEKPSVLDPR